MNTHTIVTPDAIVAAYRADVDERNILDYRQGGTQDRLRIRAENLVAQIAEGVTYKCADGARVNFLLRIARDIARPHSNESELLKALTDFESGADPEVNQDAAERLVEAARGIADDYGCEVW